MGQAPRLVVSCALLATFACFNRSDVSATKLTYTVDPRFSSMTMVPAAVVADGISVSTLRLVIHDAANAPLPNQVVSVSVSGTDNMLSHGTSVTDSNGTLLATLASTRAESKRVVATVGSVVQSANVLFLPGPPSIATSHFFASPNVLTTDGNTTTSLALTLCDIFGNRVSGYNVTLTGSGVANHFAVSNGNTDATGTFVTTLYSPTAQQEQITAAGDGYSLSANVAFAPGAVATSNFVINPNTSAVSAGQSYATLSLFLADAHGNKIPNAPVTFTASGTNNFISPAASGITNAAGVFDANMSSTRAQVETVTAESSSSIIQAGNVTFQAGPPNAAHSSLGASPNILVGNANSVVMLVLRDAFNNPLPGVAATFSSANSNVSLMPPSGSTDASGVLTTNMISSSVQTVYLTANGAGLTLDTQVIVNAGEASFVVSGINRSLAVGQQSGATVTVYTTQSNVATLYTGVVTFTSSDNAAALHAPYTFTASDAGMHSFATVITVQTPGTQSLVVTDANGTTGNEPNIVVTPYVVDSIYTSSNSDSLCAELNNKQLKCWGLNPSGELGYGDTQTRGSMAGTIGTALPFVTLQNGRSVVEACSNGSNAGAGHTCALLDDGNVTCWGANANGQLGFADTLARQSPVATEISFGGSAAQYIRCGFGGTCALLTNGQLMCWGLNRNGQLGVGDLNDRLLPTLINPPPSRTWADVQMGGEWTCGLLDNATVTCWGLNSNGQLGYGDYTLRKSPPPTPLSLGGGNQAVGISIGGTSTCALLPNQQVTCWGANAHGQLGFGDTAQRTAGANIIAFSGNPLIASVAAGGADFACALTTTGDVYCWGRGFDGELGLESSGDQSMPTVAINLGTQRKATSIAAGNIFSCAVLDNDMLKCWGANYAGYLGLGDNTNRGANANTMGDYLPYTKLW